MENIWYIHLNYLIILVAFIAYFKHYSKEKLDECKKINEECENKYTALSKYVNKEFIKIKFEFNNKPKYSVGENIKDYIVLFVGVEESVNIIGYSTPKYSYYNNYEVFDKVKKVKATYCEKDFLKMVG